MTTGDPGFDASPPVVSVPPDPVPGPVVWWHRVGLAGAVLGFAASALLVAGSLLPLLVVDVVFEAFGDEPVSLRVTGWGAQTDRRGEGLLFFGKAPANGAPVVFAAVAVFAGAAVGLYAARRPAGRPFQRVAVVTAAIGAAFVAGTVWTIGMQEVSWLDGLRRVGEFIGDDGDFSMEVGTGFWLLLLATGAAIAAAVCTALPAPNGPPAGHPNDPNDPATPRYGFAVVTRLPDAEPDPPPPNV